MRAVTAVGARTPRLRGGPVALAPEPWAFAVTYSALTYMPIYSAASPPQLTPSTTSWRPNHPDLQPANVLCDDAGAWLLDMEYAALAPREWDPTKLVILARRFGDPPDVDDLLDVWTRLDRVRHASMRRKCCSWSG